MATFAAPRYHAVVRLPTLLLASILVQLSPAHAQEAQPDEDRPTSYWHVSFLGGLLKPLADTADTHDYGLVAGGRIGWSHRSGLGLAVGGYYSPLPRLDSIDPLETYESHFVVLTGGPQLSLMWKKLRVWMAGGGGMAYERSRRFYRNVAEESKSESGLAASASAGVELHFISSGGLVIAGNYVRTFKTLAFSTERYQLGDLSAGLVFLFR